MKNAREHDTFRLTGPWTTVQAFGWRLLEEGKTPSYILYPARQEAAIFWTESTEHYCARQFHARRCGFQLAYIHQPARQFLKPFTLANVQYGLSKYTPVRLDEMQPREPILVPRPRKNTQVLSDLYVLIDSLDHSLSRQLQACGQQIRQHTLASGIMAVYFHPTVSQRKKFQITHTLYFRAAFRELYEQDIQAAA
jgi:hypothetical protein